MSIYLLLINYINKIKAKRYEVGNTFIDHQSTDRYYREIDRNRQTDRFYREIDRNTYTDKQIDFTVK